MHLPGANQFFAFVWGSRNVSHAVVDVARLTSSRAIFDLNVKQFAQMAAALRAVGATAVKISAADLMQPELDLFLEESGVKTLWVEYHPDLFPGTPEVGPALGPMRLPTGHQRFRPSPPPHSAPWPRQDCRPQRQRGSGVCGWGHHRRPLLQHQRDVPVQWP
jgi:hypothetical protein